MAQSVRGEERLPIFQQPDAAVMAEHNQLKAMISTMCTVLPKYLDYNVSIEQRNGRLKTLIKDSVAGRPIDMPDVHSLLRKTWHGEECMEQVFEKINSHITDEAETPHLQTFQERLSGCIQEARDTNENAFSDEAVASLLHLFKAEVPRIYRTPGNPVGRASSSNFSGEEMGSLSSLASSSEDGVSPLSSMLGRQYDVTGPQYTVYEEMRMAPTLPAEQEEWSVHSTPGHSSMAPTLPTELEEWSEHSTPEYASLGDTQHSDLTDGFRAALPIGLVRNLNGGLPLAQLSPALRYTPPAHWSLENVESNNEDRLAFSEKQYPWTTDTLTAIIRNIPARLTAADLARIWPPRGSYNILYVPFSHRLKRKIGIGFVNFFSNEAASAFREQWSGQSLVDGAKGLSIGAAEIQGFVANINLLKGSKKIKSIRNPNHLPLILRADGTATEFKQVMHIMQCARRTLSAEELENILVSYHGGRHLGIAAHMQRN